MGSTCPIRCISRLRWPNDIRCGIKSKKIVYVLLGISPASKEHIQYSNHGESLKSRKSKKLYIWTFLHPPVASPTLYPNIINTLFSHNFSLCLSRIVRGQLSHALKIKGEVTILRNYTSGESKLTVLYQSVGKWTHWSDPHSNFTIESVSTRRDKKTVKILDLQNAQLRQHFALGKESRRLVQWSVPVETLQSNRSSVETL